MKHLFFALILLLTPNYAFGEELAFVVAGQSNAVGRGYVSELPVGFPAHSSRILNFTNAWIYKTAVEPIDIDSGQVHVVSQDTGLGVIGVGFSLAFADRVTTNTSTLSVVLVPCPRRATFAYQWLPNYNTTTLYGSMLMRAEHAARRARIGALLYMQGESDAFHATRSYEWAANTSQIFRNFRKDMNEPNLPIVYVQLWPGYGGALYAEVVRSQQASLQDENTIMVTSPSGPLYDSQHLGTEAQITLGHLMAEAYLAWREAHP